MAQTGAKLEGLLESVVGRGRVRSAEGLRIGELTPELIVEPSSSEEAADCLRICSEQNAAVIPAGLGTWLDHGNPVTRADVVLSLKRLNRMIDFSAADLTASIEGGVTLQDFNAAAGLEGQWLPLDPPGFSNATLGAVVACASSGALRLAYGTPRDYVIGLRLAHADGSQSRSGGRVVKNVAGYDMNKLYVGSFGTLAVLTELIVKLRPRPECFRTVAITSDDRQSLGDTAKRVLDSELGPASVFLTTGLSLGLAQSRGTALVLLIRFADSEAAVRYQTDSVMRLVDQRSEVATADEALWSEVAELDDRGAIALRMSVRLADCASALDGLLNCWPDGVVAADMGTGVIRAAVGADDSLGRQKVVSIREKARARGGSLIIERAPASLRRGVDAWGEIGETAELMKAIKSSFDPKSILNPGLLPV